MRPLPLRPGPYPLPCLDVVPAYVAFLERLLEDALREGLHGEHHTRFLRARNERGEQALVSCPLAGRGDPYFVWKPKMGDEPGMARGYDDARDAFRMLFSLTEERVARLERGPLDSALERTEGKEEALPLPASPDVPLKDPT